MAFGRSRQETSAIVHTHCVELLQELMRFGTLEWPLPPPPVRDADLPVVEPASPAKVVEMGVGLFSVDRASMVRHLDVAREAIIPHRLSLTVDPQKEGERWLLRRLDEVAERILFATCEEWLGLALDPDAPDGDRWYIGISLLNGLCRAPTPQATNRGYHMLESIALAHPPGSWPTRQDPGPHQVDWKPENAPGASVGADEAGIDASHWLLDQLEQGDLERRALLVSWLRLMIERPALVTGLALPMRLEQMVRDQPVEVAAELVGCLPRLFELDEQAAQVVLISVRMRRDLQVRRALAEVLPALLRVLGTDALNLLDELLADSEVDIQLAAASALRQLAVLFPQELTSRLAVLAEHEDVRMRRLLAQTVLRDYLELHPDDEHGFLVKFWLERDDVSRARLRELLIRQQDVVPEGFSSVARNILDADGAGLDDLWATLEVRDADRVQAWRGHLAGEGPLPAPTP